jgi:hypothetical protein
VELTTFPGLRFDLLHVEVSVVQQLKHLRRILSLSLVAASSVYIGDGALCPGGGYGELLKVLLTFTDVGDKFGRLRCGTGYVDVIWCIG